MNSLAPAGGIKEQLGTIYKQIKEAQTLDIHGDEMGAYRHYLSSVGLAAHLLSADIQANQGRGTLPEQQVAQLYKMMRDCLERGHDIIDTARKEQRPLALFRMATPSPTISPTLPTHPMSGGVSHYAVPHPTGPSPPSSYAAPHPPSSSPASSRVAQHPQYARNAPQNLGIRTGQNRAHHPHHEGLANRNMSWPSGGRRATGTRSLPRGLEATDGIPGGHVRGAGPRGQGQQQPSNSGGGPVHTMPFMAEAKLRNRHMMEQYKSHLRQQYAGNPTYNEAGLSMLRRLEENLSVARIREKNIAMRLKEKQQRVRETGVKPKAVVVLSTLSVEEMCEQVSNFEHGKNKLNAIKARLNASNSDPSIVYSAISEILSISDHPLSRLLGEYQYSVYMTLQPVGAAVEKAGGLPQLGIQLDQGMDRKPSSSSGGGGSGGVATEEEGRRRPPPLSRGGVSSDDDLLELLCDGEEEEEEGEGSREGAGSEERPLADSQAQEEQNLNSITFNSKLERLRQELLASQNGNEEEGEGEGQERRENGDELLSDSNPRRNGTASDDAGASDEEHQLRADPTLSDRMADSDGDEPRYIPAPTAKGATPSSRNGGGGGDEFQMQGNECYSGVSHAQEASVYNTPIDAMGGASAEEGRGHDQQNIYEDVDGLTAGGGEERGRGQEGGSIYEDLDAIDHMMKRDAETGNGAGPDPEDSVFAREQERTYDDIPDGGMLSRQAPPRPPPPPEEIELEQVAVFKNLPPLVCTAHLGDEVAMRKLADTAGAVITEVVKHIHNSLDQLLACFSQCYPIISRPDNQELCRTVLEASFFPAILSPLTIVYRCKHYSEEVAVAKNMCRQVNASPRDLNVRKKYWLLEQSHAPYGEAIDELRRITSFQYPSPKLECLVKMSKQVVECIKAYHDKYCPNSKLDLVGVDDMLPILSYVILRSGLPQLVSECSIMEEFIQEGYIMGEEGFCLTSFLTALKYVTQMSS